MIHTFMPPPLQQTTMLYCYIILALHSTSRNYQNNRVAIIQLLKSRSNCVFQWVSNKKNQVIFRKTLLHPKFSSFAIFGKVVKNTNVNGQKFLNGQFLQNLKSWNSLSPSLNFFWALLASYFGAKKQNLYGVIFFFAAIFFEKKFRVGNRTKKNIRKKNISQNPDFLPYLT